MDDRRSRGIEQKIKKTTKTTELSEYAELVAEDQQDAGVAAATAAKCTTGQVRPVVTNVGACP